MIHGKHGKLCSRPGESSLEPSQEGSKSELVLESLFGAFWRPLLGPALKNSWLQGNPKKCSKGGPKGDPHFWSRAGGMGGPTREFKASPDKDQIPDLIRAHQKNTPVPPSTGVGGFNPLRTVRRARLRNTCSTTLAPFLTRVTFGGLEMQLSDSKTDFGAQGAPRLFSTEISSPFRIHFGIPKNNTKSDQNPFLNGVWKCIQKQAHIQEAKKLYLVVVYHT